MGAARRLVPAPRGPASSWFRRGRSADLPRYYAKHSKTDRLDSQLLAGLPMLHADGPQLIMKARRTLSPWRFHLSWVRTRRGLSGHDEVVRDGESPLRSDALSGLATGG